MNKWIADSWTWVPDCSKTSFLFSLTNNDKFQGKCWANSTIAVKNKENIIFGNATSFVIG